MTAVMILGYLVGIALSAIGFERGNLAVGLAGVLLIIGVRVGPAVWEWLAELPSRRVHRSRSAADRAEIANRERILIACALLDLEKARRLSARVVPSIFADPTHARCWAAVARVAVNGAGPLAMMGAVALELDRDPPGLVALRDCADLMPRAANTNADYFGRLVTDAYTRRVWRRRIRNAAIIVYAPVLALTFAARWIDEDLRGVITAAPLTAAFIGMMVGGALLFAHGEAEERAPHILAGVGLLLAPLALGFLVFWWW